MKYLSFCQGFACLDDGGTAIRIAVKVLPVAPGPDYISTPGYWNWNGTVWVRVGARRAHRPWHGAVWVGGHWVHRGHGHVWISGHWH